MVLIIDGFEVEGTLPVSQLFDKWGIHLTQNHLYKK